MLHACIKYIHTYIHQIEMSCACSIHPKRFIYYNMHSKYNKMADLFTSTMLKFPQYSVSFEDPFAFTTTISFVSCSICFNISQWYQLMYIQLTMVYVLMCMHNTMVRTYIIHDLDSLTLC